jgi:galactokinase
MMGGGFGGCALALVKSEAVEDFVELSATSYAELSNLPGDFFAVRPADGVRLVDN